MILGNRAAARLALCVLASGFAASAQTPEFRALWVDTFHAGIKTSSQITTLVNDLRAGNFNAVIPEVRKRGDAYYISRYEPSASDMTSTNSLAELIAKAHNTNGGLARIEVHPWIVTYIIWNSTNPPPEPNHPYNLHPDWLTQNDAGVRWNGNYAFDPGHPEVQRYTFNVAMDIISNYDVDGFNFDYIRYSGNTWGYNPVAVARFNRLYGRSGQPLPTDPLWMQFRRDQVTALVRKVYLSAIAIKPRVKISADTITWAPGPTTDLAWTNSSAAYRNVLQDWRSWMEEGILDLNIPMTYFDQSGLYTVSWTNWNNFAKNHRYNRHVAIGPGIYLNTLSNSLLQMRFVRMPSPAGNSADGLCGYSYAVPTSTGLSRSTFLAALTSTNTSRLYETNPVPIFATRVPPPVMPWKTAPTRSHIKGFVYGGSATNPIDGATVTLSGGVARTIVSDATGFYGFVDLPPGNYSVSSAWAGFVASSSNVAVTAGIVSHADLLLTTNETTPPGISAVNAVDISDSGARITWNTDEPASSIVDYGTQVTYGMTRSNAALVYAHSIQLSNLAANTTYHYRVRSRDASGNLAASADFVFTTNPLGVVSDIIVDNPSAIVVGSWQTGTSSTDKFGSDYRFKSQGDGSGLLRFVPNILKTGQYAVYEWHPQGNNRTTNAPHVITCNGARTTIYVNQKTNGGRWNLLGVFPFGETTDACVEITDGFNDGTQVVLADAIKFVFVPAPPSIVAHPQNQSVRLGGTATFSVSATGTPPLSYQWRFKGADLTGATGTILARANVNTNHAGVYSVIVRNAGGEVESSNATLTVTMPLPPRIDQISLLPDQRVRLVIASETGFPFQVEAAQRLGDWTVLATGTNTTGTAIFDTPATNRPGRFYRVLAR